MMGRDVSARDTAHEPGPAAPHRLTREVLWFVVIGAASTGAGEITQDRGTGRQQVRETGERHDTNGGE